MQRQRKAVARWALLCTVVIERMCKGVILGYNIIISIDCAKITEGDFSVDCVAEEGDARPDWVLPLASPSAF